MIKKKIFFLVGPTASGKSAVSVKLAKKLNAEIVSCDSMQVYRGMNILTSKPKPNLLSKVKHHLLSFVPVSSEYNAALYRKDALKIISGIYKRGKVPIFVGGTGLYMSIIIDGLFDSIGEDKSLRAKLLKKAQAKGSEHIYKKLKKIDPLAALKIHAHDARRIIRALEVYYISGKLISELQATRVGLGKDYDVKVFALSPSRNLLYQRIDNRVELMFKQGLEKEVKSLLSKCLSRTAYRALGVRELEGYFNSKYDLAEAERLIKRNSRHYAKRQITWFKKDKRIKWIKVGDKETPQDVARRILKSVSGFPLSRE